MSENEDKVSKSKQEWKNILTPEEFYILREKGTEKPFNNKYYNNKEAGIYICKGCDSPLFDYKTKYDSGTGWPSFFKPIESNAIEKEKDTSLGIVRVEVTCATCGGHLGHVFDDGPKPTGLRYCINSEALKFSINE